MANETVLLVMPDGAGGYTIREELIQTAKELLKAASEAGIAGGFFLEDKDLARARAFADAAVKANILNVKKEPPQA